MRRDGPEDARGWRDRKRLGATGGGARARAADAGDDGLTMLTLPSVLQRTLRLHGERPAVRDDEGDLTWARFGDHVARAATVLADRGVQRGQRFAVIGRNSYRQAELIHGGYWSGTVPVPINYRLAVPEIVAILDDAECTDLAIESPFLDLLDDPALGRWRDRAFCIDRSPDPRWPDYDTLKATATQRDPHDPDENDDAILLYTGGTTGRAKGVRLSHRNIVANALQLAHLMSARADDVYLHSAPMFHSTHLKATAMTMCGGAHAYLADFTSARLLDAIARHQVTIASLVPTMIIRLLEAPDLGRRDLSKLRLITYGTSPMPAAWTKRTMKAFPGVGLHQYYGLTETSPVVAALDEDDHRRAMMEKESLLKAAGRPLSCVDVRIVDEAGNDLPIGGSGEIVLRGPQLTKGYLNRPKENAEAFRDGWFHTGDVGAMDSEGYLYVLDRKTEMVVTGGENVYTQEVEAALCQCPGISEAAVFGVPHPQFGEALMAAIVPRNGQRPAEKDIITFSRHLIAGYKIPRRFMFVDALPRSAVGKVLKHELRRLYADPTGDGQMEDVSR
jgi:long-chain acyl-CoA synthetase